MLEKWYPFNSLAKTNLQVEAIKKDSIPGLKKNLSESETVREREVIRLLSVGHGQSVLKCNCKGACIVIALNVNKNVIRDVIMDKIMLNAQIV